MKNPKFNIQNPKEIRSPNAEVLYSGSPARCSEFWVWGDEPIAGDGVLHEDGANSSSPPDLLERTAKFGEAIIAFAKRIPQGPVTNRLIDQVVGAGTSVGANYCEADDAVSKKDFKNKIGTCRKESKETMHFLRMIAAAVAEVAPDARRLWGEAKQLNRIFGAMWRS